MDKTFIDHQGEHGRDRQESVDLQVEMARSYLDIDQIRVITNPPELLEM